MRRALVLARRGRGFTAPNPMVGCVIVRSGKIIGEGYHRRAGGDHAEVAALKSLAGSARGATAYVTLEPCDHHGRTGPCTAALIAAGVARVVFALRDPNPRVDGRGAKRLRAAGVAVEAGLCTDESAELNRAFVKWITTGMPWVTLKAAVTLDGKIATRTGDSKWITGERARRVVHQMRAAHDAILVGASTVTADDPQLTVRSVRGRDPQRVLLDGRLTMRVGARAIPGALIVTTAKGGAQYVARGAEIIRLAGRDGKVALDAMLLELGKRRITSLLVEGGAEVYAGFLRAGLVDELAVFVAPKLIGGDGLPMVGAVGVERLSQAIVIEHAKTRVLGDDLLVTGRPARAKVGRKPPR